MHSSSRAAKILSMALETANGKNKIGSNITENEENRENKCKEKETTGELQNLETVANVNSEPGASSFYAASYNSRYPTRMRFTKSTNDYSLSDVNDDEELDESDRSNFEIAAETT